MKLTPSSIAGIRLLAPNTPEFEEALAPLLGDLPRERIAAAIPFSVIVINGTRDTIALLGVRFDMTGPRAKPYSVIHYADTLRHPERADFLPGSCRFVCAEPAYTSLVLRKLGDPGARGRINLDNLRKMLGLRASLDCVAFADGRFEGPDTLGAFARLARQREREAELVAQTSGGATEELLNAAVNEAGDSARLALARRLLESLQTGGGEAMLARAREHRLKIPVWRAD